MAKSTPESAPALNDIVVNGSNGTEVNDAEEAEEEAPTLNKTAMNESNGTVAGITPESAPALYDIAMNESNETAVNDAEEEATVLNDVAATDGTGTAAHVVEERAPALSDTVEGDFSGTAAVVAKEIAPALSETAKHESSGIVAERTPEIAFVLRDIVDNEYNDTAVNRAEEKATAFNDTATDDLNGTAATDAEEKTLVLNDTRVNESLSTAASGLAQSFSAFFDSSDIDVDCSRHFILLGNDTAAAQTEENATSTDDPWDDIVLPGMTPQVVEPVDLRVESVLECKRRHDELVAGFSQVDSCLHGLLAADVPSDAGGSYNINVLAEATAHSDITAAAIADYDQAHRTGPVLLGTPHRRGPLPSQPRNMHRQQHRALFRRQRAPRASSVQPGAASKCPAQ